jgi:acyl-coenzyme A thioesterase PaaI-like protein
MNRLTRQLAKIDRVPAPLRTWVRSRVLGRVVPLTGTNNLRYEVMTPEHVVVSIANRKHVRNHIGGVHAMASSLAAETATGMIVGMNVRDDCTPVVKSIGLQFVKRGQGAMRAEARLSPEQRRLITSTEKGAVVVPVTITDESGNQPITCEFIWAWVPNVRAPKSSANTSTSSPQ